MLARLRFWLYRSVVAIFTLVAFRAQRVRPLDRPRDQAVEFEPYAAAHPELAIEGLFLPTSFPIGDHAASRLRRIKIETVLLALVKRIAPARTPPVPRVESHFVAAVYPRLFRRAWPHAPSVPAPVARTDDLIAELAVRGPFASYLQRVDGGGYTADVNWISNYDVAPGLARPGGAATFTVRDGRLSTAHVGPTGAYLAALNEDLTTFRHNVSVHLALLTPFALASTNHLTAFHPVRRLLHHCFNTVLIGNVELAAAELSGPDGFSATIFSHERDELLRMIHEHLSRFDFWDFEPETQFAWRGTAETPFPYPYRDNIMQLWAPTRAYVDSYLHLYYERDEDVAKDSQLDAWAAALDALLPNGVAVPNGGITFDWLTRACATLIHVSTVEHDYLNNVVWNYATLGWLIPTVVPATGGPMDQRRAFDLIATLIGTWKPYNMLLTSDVPALALDDRAAKIMHQWIEELARVQAEMVADDPSVSYPANLNVSISN